MSWHLHQPFRYVPPRKRFEINIAKIFPLLQHLRDSCFVLVLLIENIIKKQNAAQSAAQKHEGAAEEDAKED
uniref:Uncharacterized protein n=1 Tax=Bursaphelenchus xylophilus TaxID=6326 RepID=A0A1I7SE84_BURXY